MPDTHHRHLSPRQRQTLKLLLTGMSEQEIADKLGVGFETAHTYVQAVFRAHRVQSRAMLMARYLRRARRELKACRERLREEGLCV